MKLESEKKEDKINSAEAAYGLGNELYPQTYFGIIASMAKYYMDNLPSEKDLQSYINFFTGKPNQTELNEIYQTMERHHKARGMTVKVSPETLENLFYLHRYLAISFISNLIFFKKNGYLFDDMFSKDFAKLQKQYIENIFFEMRQGNNDWLVHMVNDTFGELFGKKNRKTVAYTLKLLGEVGVLRGQKRILEKSRMLSMRPLLRRKIGRVSADIANKNQQSQEIRSRLLNSVIEDLTKKMSQVTAHNIRAFHAEKLFSSSFRKGEVEQLRQ